MNVLHGLQWGMTGSDLHLAACRFTEKHYKRRFGCELRHFMPASFSLYEGARLLAVAGCRGAGDETLFLEQYLDSPVETALAGRLGTAGGRETIVEIGGLAAENRAAAFELMTRLAPALLQLGYRTAVCTVNRPVRTCLDRLGIASVCLGPADSARVDTDGTEWGTYYEGDPEVLAGDIGAGVMAIETLAGTRK